MTGEHVSFALPLRIRLFLEGVEVPIISATIQTSPNSPSMATFQVPPLVEGTRLLPRTLVHLFFLDMYATSNPYVTATNLRTSREDANQSPTAVDEAQASRGIAITPSPCGHRALGDSENRRYKLLFVGEVIGFQWTKSPVSRSLVLQCQDLSNYWDYAYQWGNTGIFGPGYKAIFSGGATNLFTDFLSSKGSVITQIVSRGKCNTYPQLKGLAAGIIRLIEAIGGSYYARPDPKGKATRKYAGQNVFFSTAELRLHITQMIAAVEDDPTSKRILSRQGYSGMFNRAIGGQGAQVSIRKAINALSAIMFHETYAQPCPLYIPGKEGQVSGVRRVNIRNSEWKIVSDNALDVLATVEAVQSSLASLATLSAQAKSDSIAAEAWKDGIEDARLRLQRAAKFLNETLPLIRGAPPPSSTIFSASSKALRNADAWVKKWTPKSPESIKKKVDKFLEEAAVQLRRAEYLTVNTTPLKDREPARMAQQIFRPDIWFGAPPRCNVLFPENYMQLTYQRIYLQEPTRFMLKTNDEFYGEDFLFDRFYFAPQAGSLKKEKANLKSMLRNDLLDHELFTGILPVFEKMGEFNIFASKSWTTEGKVPKVGLAQRSANFLYFKHRFNSRQMQVSGRFNPYIACGFPGLILDKWVDTTVADQLQAMRKAYQEATGQTILPEFTRGLLGTNFLGNFMEVTHSLSHQQAQGRTEIRCTYPRQPEESVEFLGTAERAQNVQVRDDLDAKRSVDVAALSPPAVNSLGPNGGKIVAVKEVTTEYSRARAGEKPGLDDDNIGRFLPVFFGGTRRKGGKPPDASVPVGTYMTLREMGAAENKELLDLIGDPDKTIVFRAFRLTEEIPRYRREIIDLPAEELIRPGWYGDIWTPGKIGKVYNQFFATGAITDPTYVLDSDGSALGSTSEEMARSSEEGEKVEGTEEDPRINVPAVTSLAEGSSIEQAVEFLTLTYSYVKTAGLDVDEFIRAYTWRPIATMLDIFGSHDLEYSPGGEEVTSGTEGFHSRSFGPYNNLFGLVSPEIEDVLGFRRGSTTAQKADTRARKLEAVLSFASQLSFSRAILG